MKGQIFSIISAAKQLGGSAIACIGKGIVSGIAIALVLTLCCFWWGDSFFGLKYIFGFIFFVVSAVAISICRIANGGIKLLDKAVDNVLQDTAKLAEDKLGFLLEKLEPSQQFDRAKEFLGSRCPAISPLLASVSYQQVQSLISKSSKVIQLSAQFSSHAQAVSSFPDIMKSLASPVKLVWQVPVSLFVRKVFFLVGAFSLVIIGVRALMIYWGA